MATQKVMSVSYRQIGELKPFERNARTHSKKQIRKIADSIRQFGWTNPILVNAETTVIAGHGRVAAAKLLGLEQVPTIRLDHLTSAQVQAYVIADNRLAEEAGWDQEILKIELQHLIEIEDFDITLTGFEIAEVDLILSDEQRADADDQLPEMSETPVCRLGDLWCLGDHRVLCASATERSSYKRLMAGALGHIVFTDPPYNVAINGHVCGNGSIKHDEFAMGCGEMNSTEFTNFLDRCMARLKENTANGSVHYLCMDWRHMQELLAAGSRQYSDLLNLCVWVKDNGGMGSFYRSRHELVFVYRNGKESHRNNIELGRYGRNRTNVWEYPGISTMSKQSGEGNLLALHPTVKPIQMVADALLDSSAPNEIVLDPFLGSGTTLLAAERIHRKCCGMELDPKYVDVCIRRWEKLTGQNAIHEDTGQTFTALSVTKEAVGEKR
jgi:DNA modification methylase